MDDWRLRIDVWEEQAVQQRAGRSRAKPATGQGVALVGPTMPRSRWSQERSLAAHQRRFRCHVCRTPSRGPVTSWQPRFYWMTPPGDDEECHTSVEYNQHTHWDKPTGLARCGHCKAWTCDDHLYKQLCQTCAYKL